MATKKPITVPAKKPIKAPANKVVAKKPVAKKPVAKKPVAKKTAPAPIVIDVSSTTKSASSMLDKAIDLIKWVDSPFKLFEVILLASVFFFGYFAWDSRAVILEAITQSSKITNLKEVNHLIPVAASLQKDLEAVTVVVHKATLVVNTRTTLLSFGPKGRDNTLDGLISSLFNKDPGRNAAIIGMLNGEVICDKLEGTSKSSEWEIKQGATFICRGGIPPEVGDFDGYVAVGFKTEPSDLGMVKTRINLAAADMSQ
jgi:hypothetical protein